MFRSILRCCVLAGVAVLVACQSASAPEVDENVVASFDLVRFNGAPLPVMFPSGLYLTGGQVVVYRNGSFREQLSFPLHIGAGGNPEGFSKPHAEVTTGVWSQIGSASSLEFRYSDRLPFAYDTASVSDSALTLHCAGYNWCPSASVLVFVK